MGYRKRKLEKGITREMHKTMYRQKWNMVFSDKRRSRKTQQKEALAVREECKDCFL